MVDRVSIDWEKHVREVREKEIAERKARRLIGSRKLRKLTDTQVREIRKARKKKYTYKEIAIAYGVTINVIRQILNGNTYKDVT